MKPLVGALVATALIAGVAVPRGSARADEVYIAPAPARPMLDRRGSHRVKVAGIVLSVMGTALVVSGAAIAGTARDRHPDEWTAANAAGTALIVPGALAITAGIPMWIIGARSERSYGVVRLGLAPTGVHGTF